MRTRGTRRERAGQAGWIRTAKLAFFVELGFIRFVGESTSLQPPETRAVWPQFHWCISKGI